jgi:hypothetical protein
MDRIDTDALNNSIDLRNLAGKIFHLGMLMYGKEPGWKEMAHWLKQV